MKHTILLTICFLSIHVYAQTPSPTPGYSDSEPKPVVHLPSVTPATLAELQAKAKAVKIKDDLIFQYDKFSDETLIVSKPENLVGSWEGAFAIMASSGPYRSGTPRLIMVDIRTRFAGQTLRETPDAFVLFFDGMDYNWQWLKTDKRLYFLFDGDNRFQLEALASDADVKSGNKVTEQVAYKITREQVELLTKAKKVELRIGTAPPRELKPKVRERWQSLLTITELAKQ